MPVSFLTAIQRENYGRFASVPTPEELARFFYISDDDHLLITRRRGNHNKLGFAIQLSTVRFLGTFLSDPFDIPDIVLQTVAGQLKITEIENLQHYRVGEQRWEHASEIRDHHGYREITDPTVGFRLNRWLCIYCWTGTDRPSVLFDRAKNWLLVNKVLLPGVTVLERQISRVRSRMEIRLWRLLVRGITTQQGECLENLGSWKHNRHIYQFDLNTDQLFFLEFISFLSAFSNTVSICCISIQLFMLQNS